MCGVAGIVAPTATAEWRASVLDRLLLEARSRGSDATGIACVDQGEMVIVKDGKDAGEFVYSNEEYKKIRKSLPPIVIGHCRAATKRGGTGSDDNKNNHPFYAEESGIALIHNGLIADDEKWRQTVGKKNGLRNTPKSTVDSEVMLMTIETWLLNTENPKLQTMEDAIDDAVYNVAGSYTLCIIKKDMPNNLWLLRHNNPLALAWLPDNNAIVFGSTEEIIKDALCSYRTKLKFFREQVYPKHVINTAVEDVLVSISISPEKEGQEMFSITQKTLEAATSAYSNHRRAAAEYMGAVD